MVFRKFPVLVTDQSGESVDCSRLKVRRGGKRVTDENRLDNVHMHADSFSRTID